MDTKEISLESDNVSEELQKKIYYKTMKDMRDEEIDRKTRKEELKKLVTEKEKEREKEIRTERERHVK